MKWALRWYNHPQKEMEIKMTDRGSVQIIGRNALWSILNQSSGQILALVVFLVTARFVDKDAFGVMAIALVVIEFFRQILIESVGISLAAKQNPTKDDYNAGFCIILLGSVFSALVMFALAHPTAVFLKDPDIEHALQLTCLVLLAMGLSRTHETWMAKNMRFRLLAIRSIIAYLIGGGIGIYMAVHGYGLLSLITQQIVTSVLSVSLLWLASSWRPEFRLKKENAQPLLNYSKHVALNAFTGVVGAQGDTFFASYYLGSAATGVYNASKRILLSMQLMINTGLNSVALPVFAERVDDTQRLKYTYLKATTFTAFLTAPLYVGLLFLSQDFVRIVLGDKWLEVAPILAIACIPGFLASLDQYNTNVRLVSGKPHWQTWLTAFNSILNIILLVAVARHGLFAMALALTIKSLLVYPVSLYLAMKLMEGKMRAYFMEIVDVVTAALFMGSVVYYLDQYLPDLSPLANVAVLVPAGAAVYFLSLFVLNRKMFMHIADAGFSLIRRA